mgnify:CR=1 FL=1
MSVSNKNFNNIKVHTQYSICEGAIKIDELADYCKTNKIQSLGLADSYNLCGALEFSEKLSKVGTQPIIGTQINFKFKDIRVTIDNNIKFLIQRYTQGLTRKTIEFLGYKQKKSKIIKIMIIC